MKRLIACAAMGLAVALPNISEAHDFHGGSRGGYHGGGGYSYHGGYAYHGGGYGRGYGGGYGGGYGYGGPGRFIGDALALPFVAGAAIIGAAAAVATAPLYAGGYDAPPAQAYGPPAGYYQQPAPTYYAPPPQVYYAPPGYYAPRPVYPGY